MRRANDYKYRRSWGCFDYNYVVTQLPHRLDVIREVRDSIRRLLIGWLENFQELLHDFVKSPENLKLRRKMTFMQDILELWTERFLDCNNRLSV